MRKQLITAARGRGRESGRGRLVLRRMPMDAAAAASLHWGLTFMASAPRLSKNRPILRTNTTKNADEGGGGVV